MQVRRAKVRGLKDYWTATDIGIMATCPRLYLYSLGKKGKTTTGDMARGSLVHRLVEPKNFFKEDGSPKYQSAEKWANYCANQWQITEINEGTSRGVPIKWRDSAEPYILKDSIHGNCLVAYQYLVSKGVPLMAEKKFRFALEYEGMGADGKPAEREIKFRGRMDEVRAGMLIRDYKTGYSRIGDMEANHGYQLTLYALAFSALCRGDEDFRRKAGVSDEEVARWVEQNLLIPDNIQVELVQFLNWDQRIQVIPGVAMKKLEAFVKRNSERFRGRFMKFLNANTTEISASAREELESLIAGVDEESKADIERILNEHRRVLLPPAEFRATRMDYHAREIIDLVDWFELVKSTGDYWPRRVNCDGKCISKKRCDEETRKKRESKLPVQTKMFEEPYYEPVEKPRIKGQMRFKFRVERVEDDDSEEAA